MKTDKTTHTDGSPFAGSTGSGNPALVAEPLAYTITESELREWQKHVSEGLEPQVPFNRDNNVMLAAAYELRGNMLYYLNHRLAAILLYGTKTEAPDSPNGGSEPPLAARKGNE